MQLCLFSVRSRKIGQLLKRALSTLYNHIKLEKGADQCQERSIPPLRTG
jgi:hypothetical protein